MAVGAPLPFNPHSCECPDALKGIPSRFMDRVPLGALRLLARTISQQRSQNEFRRTISFNRGPMMPIESRWQCAVRTAMSAAVSCAAASRSMKRPCRTRPNGAPARCRTQMGRRRCALAVDGFQADRFRLRASVQRRCAHQPGRRQHPRRRAAQRQMETQHRYRRCAVRISPLTRESGSNNGECDIAVAIAHDVGRKRHCVWTTQHTRPASLLRRSACHVANWRNATADSAKSFSPRNKCAAPTLFSRAMIRVLVGASRARARSNARLQMPRITKDARGSCGECGSKCSARIGALVDAGALGLGRAMRMLAVGSFARKVCKE